MTKRLVAFLPFAATVDDDAMKALRDFSAGGYELNPILCDGLFSACDVHLRPDPRPANACLLCQAHAAGRMTEAKLPYRWLGRWSTPDDTQAAGAWVAGLKPHSYPTAAVDRWRLGEWVLDSVRRHLGGAPDLKDPSAAMIYASHLFSAHLAAAALDRLYRDLAPHSIFLAEDTSALARTALGVGEAHALPAVVMEPGPTV